MKKLYLILFLISIFVGRINSQELTCEDFKIGNFFIPTGEEYEKFTFKTGDSITNHTFELDSAIKKFVVIREKKQQVEWENGVGNGMPIYSKIEWIDDCTFRLTFDPAKMEMNEDRNFFNQNNGIVISMSKIKGRCLFYKATMTTLKGEEISQDGIICKE